MSELKKYTLLTPEGRKEFSRVAPAMFGFPPVKGNPKKKGTKIITCKTCDKTIAKFRRSAYPNRHVPKEKILSAVRRHYKKKHPTKFREMIKKAQRTKRKKGIIGKNPKKGKKPNGEGWKWNPKVRRWVRRKKKGRGFEFK